MAIGAADLPIENGDVNHSYGSRLPEGMWDLL